MASRNLSPVHVTARLQSESSSWELILRYVAATAATLLAIGGAQLVVPNSFVLLLSLTTLVGVPVSLYLRLHDMRLGPIRVPRLLLNGLTVIGTLIAGAIWIYLSMGETMLPLIRSGSATQFFIRFGAGDLVSLLMQIFLLFASFRSFALISDKDATLTTVPSFSVLLLLIPVHKGIEVVFYFLAWTIVATILFALDHRSEIRSTAIAYVPAMTPGQDVRMASRSLGTVLGISMAAAVGISFYLTSRDPQQRSTAESAISALATKITNLALSLPESSVNSGPERQIDFSSSPSTLTRSALWSVQAFSFGAKPVRPEYWRLFSLDRYNGTTWSQSTLTGGKSTSLRVRAAELKPGRWTPRNFLIPSGQGFGPLGGPLPAARVFGANRSNPPSSYIPLTPLRRRPGAQSGSQVPLAIDPRSSSAVAVNPVPENPSQNNSSQNNPSPNYPPSNNSASAGIIPIIPRQFRRGSGGGIFRIAPVSPQFQNGGQIGPGFGGPNTGFDTQAASPRVARQFGPKNLVIRSNVTALVPNIGYAPVVPSVRALVMRDSSQKEMRLQKDGAVDVGVVDSQQTVRVVSDVPALPEYGLPRGDVPTKKVSAEDITKSGVALTESERLSALSLPPALPKRVRDLARTMLKGAPANESNYRMAQRLSVGIQNGAVYTLRPPTIPADHDAADYFLFEGGRRGYCTYFAGALAVLCRTQGIPARVVSGFVNPEWQSGSSVGILREANAHAWTEVWVDGWGWAIVDATPSDDRGDNAPTWYEAWNDFFNSNFYSLSVWVQQHLIPIAIAAVAAIAFILQRFRKKRFGFTFRFRFRYDEDSERRAVLEIYKAISRHISKQFRPRAAWETPDEWLQPYAATLEMPDAEALRRLTALYLMARYAGSPLPQGSARLARDSATYFRRRKKGPKN